ncbi:hypothetical protein [Burkholderia contaminans]|uniref:hypothetical protein n=1 Tax=Burkholderia contaminans TaxID=488447 RepID=UPI001589FD53|nr:hypothetical protein [Burkholderia contaminans]
MDYGQRKPAVAAGIYSGSLRPQFLRQHAVEVIISDCFGALLRITVTFTRNTSATFTGCIR